ncbi:phosphate ABC transporter permease PstA [Alsobacter sp. KACC 23698]|uniref:Phosphate transport system permease protein PstA n=1 Tax=Alsobacter sp. KACC 23698 TaxID=3149229 RepID=A0AAU7JAB9_9HYPH
MKDVSKYRGRAATSSVWMALSVAATVLGLGMLCLILGSLLWNGLTSLSPRVFTEMTPPPGSAGGLLNAIVGSLMMTALGVLVGAPLGIMAGTWLAEYSAGSRLAGVVRFINDILLSAPSIVIGLFIYTIAVEPVGRFSGIAGGLALGVIVIPVVLRTTEDMLRLVPTALREASYALGMPRSLVIRKVIYSAARSGIVTGILLAVARISGETAPLLFTALNNQFFSWDMTRPVANLPYVIFQFASSPYKDSQSLAWAGAIIITMTVLVLSVTARSLSSSRTS